MRSRVSRFSDFPLFSIFRSRYLPERAKLNFTMKAYHAAAALGLMSLAAVSLSGEPLAVVEAGVGAYQVVNISSSTLGDNLWVYACSIDILVDGNSTQGFCIDPWHWSLNGTMAYNSEDLAAGPKNPGPMGAATALQVEQLWQQYYSPAMSNSNAAGLQIAIWDLVSASVSAATDGAYWYTLNSGDDYGAGSMIAWVESDPTAAAANLVAITGTGQDYVVQASALPSAILNAAAAAYTDSPFTVDSTATAPGGDLTLHSIEWMSPAGAWTVDAANVSGTTSNRTLGITFPVTGSWTLRAGASVDSGSTWIYSPDVTVAVGSSISDYTLATMAIPAASSQLWYAPSPVAQKTYQVRHVNP